MKANNQHIEWVLKAVKGDANAFRLLYDKYVDGVYRLMLSMTKDREMSKDITQEAFIQAFEKLSSLKNPQGFGAWLRRIAVNLCLKSLKPRFRFESYSDEAEDVEETNWYKEVDMDEIKSEIDKLPGGCRMVFTLYVVEEYTHDQIANALGISTGTSKSQYSYAKKLLKQSLIKKIEL